jgi:hypothetical protein
MCALNREGGEKSLGFRGIEAALNYGRGKSALKIPVFFPVIGNCA